MQNSLRQTYSYPWQFGYSENNGLSTPPKIIAGDSYDWTVDNGDYKASDGWEFKLYIRGASSLDLTATQSTENPDQFTVELTAAQSAELTAGLYKFFGRFTKGIEAHSPSGYDVAVEVIINLAASTASFDPRTDTRIIYDSVIDAIKKYATNPVKRFMINGREMEVNSLPDLYRLKLKLEWELKTEKEQEMLEKGLGRPGIHVRFQRTSG